MPDGTLTWTSPRLEWTSLSSEIKLSFSDTAEKKCPLSRSKDIVDAEDEEDEE